MFKVKICGLTRFEDIGYINSLLPDYAGFVFADSKREVKPADAKALISILDKRVKSVGVFVNQTPEGIANVVKYTGIDLIQLHFETSKEYIANLKDLVPCKIISVIRVDDKIDLAIDNTSDYTLFDTYSSDSYGGTGESFDWELVEGYSKPFFIAGGLNMFNVKHALLLNPYGLDISSGVETNGCKDYIKMKEVINIIRNFRGIYEKEQ